LADQTHTQCPKADQDSREKWLQEAIAAKRPGNQVRALARRPIFRTQDAKIRSSPKLVIYAG